MINSKLVEILRTFSEDELQRFEDFISSPYYNKLGSVTKLFKILVKYSPDFNNPALNKIKIYKRVFPEKAYNDKIMRNRMTDLVKLCELFIELKYYEKQKDDRFYYLLNGLLEKKLYKNFEHGYKIAKDFLNNSTISESVYYNRFNLNSLKHDFDVVSVKKLENVFESAELLEPLIDYFSTVLFKIIHNVYLRTNSYNTKYNFDIDLNFIESIIDFVNKKSFDSKPIILMYYHSLMLVLKPEQEINFNNLIKLKSDYFSSFDKIEQRNFLLAMISYCQNKSAKNKSYLEIQFELYKEMLDKKIYSVDESSTIHPLIFKNIVKLAASTKRFEWARNFIEDYKNKMTNGFNLNLFNFSYSYLYFKKKEFDKSLSFLSKVNYENVYDKLEVRSLLIQLYYETYSFEYIISQVDSYLQFLQNDRLISDQTKSHYLKFVKFVGKLLKIKSNSYDKLTVENLKKDISNTITYDKGWLLEKIDELKLSVK